MWRRIVFTNLLTALQNSMLTQFLSTEPTQHRKQYNCVPYSSPCHFQPAWTNSKREKLLRSAEALELPPYYQEHANYDIVPCIVMLFPFVVGNIVPCRVDNGF